VPITKLDSRQVKYTSDAASALERTVQDVLRGVVTPEDFGAIGDGVADDTAVISAALSAASITGGRLICDPSKVYGVTGPLYFGGNYAQLSGLRLSVIGGTWASGSFVLTVGENSASTSKYQDMKISNIEVVGNHVAAGGINFIGMVGGTVSSCTATQCTETQIKLGGSDFIDSQGTTYTVYEHLSCREFEWGEGGGETDYTLRTSKGLWINSADTRIVGGSFARCLHSIYGGAYYNCTIIGILTYAGQTRTDPNSVTVYLSPDAHRTVFEACRIDDGAVVLEESFFTSFVGCQFLQFNVNSNIRLVSSNTDETADGLLITNNRMSQLGASPFISYEGTGTWSSTPKIISFGNIDNNGTIAPVVEDYSFYSPPLRVSLYTSEIGNTFGNYNWTVNGGTGHTKSITFSTASVSRWQLLSSPSTESGSNAGSDFGINAYSDDGTYLFTPITIVRATGKTTFSNNIVLKPPVSAEALFQERQTTFEIPNDTTLRIKVRGSDGVTRTADITLS